MDSASGDEWAGEPADPEFYRRVLNHMPTPLLVVDDQGQIVYANLALLAIGGWDLTTATQRNFLSYIHPEDQANLVQAFTEIVDSPGARMLGSRPWAEIACRIVNVDGTIMPIEVVGSGGLLDPAVGGIIYEVRPAQTSNLLRRVLDGLSRGASMLQLLSLVGEMVASPPLDLQAVILQSTPAGELVLAASTSPELADVLRGNTEGVPWENLAREPESIDVLALPSPLKERFKESSFQDLWHVAVESPLTESTLRVIAASPTHHVPANGPVNRLARARELAAAVLLRTQADVLLAHAAEHDPLTDLPNRAAFYQLAESLDPMLERAALHMDIDGLNQVNSAFGSACGDAVLQIVADRLRVTTSDSDMIGRIGDDEFAILLSPEADESPPMTRALELASQVLDAVHDTIVVAGKPLNISTSIGVAVAPAGVSTDHLLTWADAALHDAKSGGGGRISRFGVGYR